LLKVKLEIDEPVVKTGEEVKIKLTGGPKSVCAISAIDKSVSFMGKRNAIDLEAVNLNNFTIRVQVKYLTNHVF
jgi:hypothetical protein